jgi:hypothetical protein
LLSKVMEQDTVGTPLESRTWIALMSEIFDMFYLISRIS